MRRAVVVGAAGFIGSHLCRRLAACGVPAIGCTTAAPLDEVPPDVGTVYFVAGSVTPATAERQPERVEAHLAAFGAILDRFARAGGRPRVVLASSGGTVYDPAVAPPYDERSPVAPGSSYGRAKLRMEHDLLDRAGALEPVVLRLGNVYGPGQRLGTGQGVVAHWLDAAANGRELVVYGDPEATRDYVYVADVVDAMLAVHSAARPPTVVNIGSGVPVSLRALLGVVEKVVPAGLRVRFDQGRRFDRHDAWFDVELARRALGWAARTGLVDGIEATWRSHRRA
jgi:UDP-glucose 4-epimerase